MLLAGLIDKVALRFMTGIPKFPLTVHSSYLCCRVHAQSTSIDIEEGKKSFPVSVKLKGVSLPGYVKPGMESCEIYFISAQQSPDN